MLRKFSLLDKIRYKKLYNEVEEIMTKHGVSIKYDVIQGNHTLLNDIQEVRRHANEIATRNNKKDHISGMGNSKG